MNDENNKLAKVDQAPAAASNTFEPSRENIELLKKTLMGQGMTLTDSELKLTLYQAQKRGLDPLTKQIYPTKDYTGKLNFITSIDGYRLLAQRTHEYRGQTPQEWCDEDGKWIEVWLADKPPVAARVGVYREGFSGPVYAIARYASYVQTSKDGKPRGQWAKAPDNQLSKCAEALALRKAFPEELGGMYVAEEMDQAANNAPRPKPMNITEALKAAGDKLEAGGVTKREDKMAIILGIAGITEVTQLTQLTGSHMRSVLEILHTTPIDELRRSYIRTRTPEAEVTEAPVDTQLLAEDQDPDMPPDFLKYDNDEAEVTEAELDNPVQSLPGMPPAKKRAR